MKKIKAINGYTIYLANERDEKKYHGVCEGYYYLYYSSDIKAFGLSNSDYDFEAGTIEEALEIANCSNGAKADEIISDFYTCVDTENKNEIEALLDLGIDENIIRDYLAGEESSIQLHQTVKHTGKMEGMQSCSTCCACNSNCKAYAKVEGSICSECYAMTMMDYYSGLEDRTRDNFELLTTHFLTADEIPTINCTYYRFEAFGDLENEIQFINYLNIVYANSNVNFAIWTKNPHIIDRVFKAGYKKPSNLKILVSSLMTNQTRNVDKYLYFVDHVFTVYTLEYLLANNLDGSFINCGARSCVGCHKCYKKQDGEPFYINELLKKDVNKAKKLGLILE